MLFGRGASPDLLKPYRLAQTEGCELVRIALREHATPVSRIVRIALKFLKRFCPGLRLVISFADPERGHTGSIYQAGGWLYAGMTTPSDEFIINGERVHARSLQSARKSHRRRGVAAGTAFEWARKALDPDARRVKGSSKHRYLMPLDDEMRARIAPLARPYPKRAGSADGGTSPDQGGGGGSNPTPALPPLTQEQ